MSVKVGEDPDLVPGVSQQKNLQRRNLYDVKYLELNLILIWNKDQHDLRLKINIYCRLVSKYNNVLQ